MFGIIIATHGTMSDGIKDAVKTIVGLADDIETVNLLSGESVEDLGKDILDKIKIVDQDSGVIIFTDLVSASPYNQSMLAISQLESGKKNKVHVIGGVSLPMVLEAINHRLLNTEIDKAVEEILFQGKESIGHWQISQVESDNDDDEDDDF